MAAGGPRKPGVSALAKAVSHREELQEFAARLGEGADAAARFQRVVAESGFEQPFLHHLPHSCIVRGPADPEVAVLATFHGEKSFSGAGEVPRARYVIQHWRRLRS